MFCGCGVDYDFGIIRDGVFFDEYGFLDESGVFEFEVDVVDCWLVCDDEFVVLILVLIFFVVVLVGRGVVVGICIGLIDVSCEWFRGEVVVWICWGWGCVVGVGCEFDCS